MDAFANRRARDRADVFLASAERRSIERAAVVEKDFWVCWMLARVFSKRQTQNASLDAPFVFKGGTSLSKAYAAIQRFSEDVDLTVNRHQLGFQGPDGDPSAQSSQTKAGALLERISEVGRHYVSGQFLADLRQRFSATLSADLEWALDADPDDRATLIFRYPRALSQDEYDGYISPSVRLECGARGDVWPSVSTTIRAYVVEDFPQLFKHTDVVVDVLDAERTFWEKATILHEIAYRADAASPVLPASRLSRHYYDLAQLADLPIGKQALTRIDLLRAVAQHKMIFFPRKTARFDLAVPGTMRLIPPPTALNRLRADYVAMRPMFFADPPSFETLIHRLQQLEDAINAR